MDAVFDYLTKSKQGVTPVTTKSGELPFIERRSELLKILTKVRRKLSQDHETAF